MSALSAVFYADLLGKPFEAGARGPAAYDCVGLAAELQRRLGRQVPLLASSEEEFHRQVTAGGILSNCMKLDAPDAGVIALVRMLGDEHHIGDMVDAYRIFHTSSQTGGAVIERILSPLWQRRITGFYRMDPS